MIYTFFATPEPRRESSDTIPIPREELRRRMREEREQHERERQQCSEPSPSR